MNIIAKFEYNNKTYVFYNSNNNLKIKYGYLALDGSVIEISDEDEIKMMKIISRQIFISYGKKNHIELGTTRYNDKTFRIMYDKISMMKFFYEIKEGGIYSLPNMEDTDYLMKLFNFRFIFSPNEVLSEKKTYKKLKVLERFVSFSKRVILVSFVSLIMFSSVNAKLIEDYQYQSGDDFDYTQITTNLINSYETEEEYIAPKSSTEFSALKIVETINNNQNLTPEEKEFMKGYLDILIKNKEYVDMDFLLNTLSNLDFIYYQYSDEEGALGTYNPMG
ncbi:MAG TPA: hypothetical protein PLC53_01065, partial [Bacilli bacterium]|nr:hypothetical protein [Bacilli bacterium]